MFSWFSRLFKSNVPFENHEERQSDVCTAVEDEMMDKFGSCELNILVVAGKKHAKTVSRLIQTICGLYDVGYHFHPGTKDLASTRMSSKMMDLDYDRNALDQVILSQKVSLEGFDVPPTLLVFEKCTSTNDATYRKVITQNKILRFTTLTVVGDMHDIENRLVNKMDVVIFCKDKNKTKMFSRWRSIWEKRYSRHVPYEKFHCGMTTSIGSMRAGVITEEGIHMMKFGRRGSSLITVCAFR